MTSPSTDFPEVYLSRTLDVCYTKKPFPQAKAPEEANRPFSQKDWGYVLIYFLCSAQDGS